MARSFNSPRVENVHAFNWSLCQFGEWQSHNLSSKKEKRCHKFEMRTCTCHFESILIRSSVHAPIWCTVWVWVHESREYMVMTLPFELIWASVSISLGAMRREHFPGINFLQISAVSHMVRRHGVAREADPGLWLDLHLLWLYAMEFSKRLPQSCQLKSMNGSTCYVWLFDSCSQSTLLDYTGWVFLNLFWLASLINWIIET